MTTTLTWTRWRPGFYTAGNFAIERTDSPYGPTWTLTTVLDRSFRVNKRTLHECQAAAGAAANESALITGAAVDPSVTVTDARWPASTTAASWPRAGRKGLI